MLAVVGGLCSFWYRPLHREIEDPHHTGASSPQTDWSKRDQGKSGNAFYELALQATPHQFCCVYCSWRPSLIPCGRGFHKEGVDTRNGNHWRPSWKLTSTREVPPGIVCTVILREQSCSGLVSSQLSVCLQGMCIMPVPSQVAPVVKNLPASAGDTRDTGSIPGSGGSPGVGNGNPLQDSWMENSMDRGTSVGLQRVGRDWGTEHTFQ